MKKLISILFTTLVILSLSAASGDPTFDHTTWNNLLQKYVSDEGNVDYEGFKKDQERLQSYLSELDVQPPEANWSKEATMAYWINAYNAFTVELILRNYPVKSIMDIDGGKAWDMEFINLGGKKYSLNQIEHSILRKRYGDPRIHFAVNCAAESCPKLNNEAFSENKLEMQLYSMTKQFVNNPKKNTIAADQVEISQIFDWYKEDFKTKDDNIVNYLNRFSSTRIDPSAKVTYKTYQWRLNK
jgi:hypothetical protein